MKQKDKTFFSDFDIIEDEIQRMYSNPVLNERKQAILSQLERDRIRYEFWDRHTGEYGEAETIIQELAEKYHKACSTIKKEIYPKPSNLA